MTCAAKGVYDKLQNARNILKGREQFVKPELVNYLDVGILFAKATGMYALMRLSEKELKTELNMRKKYPALVADIVFIATDLRKIQEQIYAKKSVTNLETFYFYQSYLETEMLPHAAKYDNHSILLIA